MPRTQDPLTPQQESMLDDGLLQYLKKRRMPVTDAEMYAHAELHSGREISSSLIRLRKAGMVRTFVDSQAGKMWLAITSEDECKACEVLRTTYQNPTRIMHTCAPRRSVRP